MNLRRFLQEAAFLEISFLRLSYQICNIFHFLVKISELGIELKLSTRLAPSLINETHLFFFFIRYLPIFFMRTAILLKDKGHFALC